MNDVLILTEGSQKFGLGHLSRCSALAQALRNVSRRSVSIQFMIEGDSTAKKMLAADKTCKAKICAWHSMNTEQLTAKIRPFKTVIIDSYHLKQKHYEKLRSHRPDALWIVDDDKRLDYQNTNIINPSPAGRALKYKKSNCVLTGKDYVILRPVFWKDKKKVIKANIKNVFISLGGGEPDTLLLNCIIRKADQLENVTLHLLSTKKVKPKGLRSKLKQYFYLNEIELKALLSKTDLAITACGQTLYELAKCGIPTIGISIIANQMGNVKSLKCAGFLKYIGKKEDLSLTKKLSNAMTHLKPAANRRTYSLAGQKSIDGHGASRIARAILKRTLNESNN